ncbi:hypothetical protein [Elizabethkingia meningoseptica]|uniref:hypothetical protein n=1 Tax=Elizabethkingia meningoseptica TaxID=238 RepID=UPI00315971C2
MSLTMVCASFGVLSSTNVQSKAGEVWLGITYVGSKKGKLNAEASTAVGAIGIADAAVWGFAVGSVATPVAGAVAGAVAGL